MKSREFREKVKNIGVLNRRMEKVSLESRLPLEAVFHRLAEDRRKEIYGERQHAKFSGSFYRVEYDFWERNKTESGSSQEVLNYEDDISNCSFANEQNKKLLFMGYNIKTPYFDERIKFLRTLDDDIAKFLAQHDHPESWLQCDEKKTELMLSFSLSDTDAIYPFLRAHIKDTFERH